MAVAVALSMAAVPPVAVAAPSDPRTYVGPDAAPPAAAVRTVPASAAAPSPKASVPENADETEPAAADEEDLALDAQDVPSLEEERMGSYFRAGGILVGVGVLLAGGAIAMGVSDPCAKGSGNNCHEDARNRAALAMGIPGLAVLAAGITFLGLGGRLRRRVRAGLAIGPRGAHGAIAVRF